MGKSRPGRGRSWRSTASWILRAGNLPERVIAYAADILPLYATAYAFEEGIQAEQMSEHEIARYYDQVGEYFRSLPPDRFPHIHALSACSPGPRRPVPRRASASGSTC